MLITAHYFACFWYLVGSWTESKGKESWRQLIPEDSSNFTKYVLARHALHALTFDACCRYSYSWYWAIVTLFTTVCGLYDYNLHIVYGDT